jgi:NADPH-dependent 2,4-dienoyl-CoA reductase/sulfur reductase-like enzyme
MGSMHTGLVDRFYHYGKLAAFYRERAATPTWCRWRAPSWPTPPSSSRRPAAAPTRSIPASAATRPAWTTPFPVNAPAAVNPRACHETELSYAKSAKPRRIAVIGAGPAGLSAATVAAQRGHAVTLFEASDGIGGQSKVAMQIPGKEEFAETIRYFTRKLELTGVDVRLNRHVTREQLLAAGFDDVIVATGVRMRMPAIPGIGHPKVLSYLSVLRDKAPVGKRVAIIGAGGIGFDTGEFLLHDPRHPLPQPIAAWTREWGVDLNATVEGGLVKPAPAQPYRQLYLLQRKSARLGAGLGKTSGAVQMLAGGSTSASTTPGCTSRWAARSACSRSTMS